MQRPLWPPGDPSPDHIHPMLLVAPWSCSICPAPPPPASPHLLLLPSSSSPAPLPSTQSPFPAHPAAFTMCESWCKPPIQELYSAPRLSSECRAEHFLAWAAGVQEKEPGSVFRDMGGWTGSGPDRASGLPQLVSTTHLGLPQSSARTQPCTVLTPHSPGAMVIPQAQSCI